ncbi:excinuclease ABC subunit A [Rhizobium mongolense subsp. loessense]|jgi:excinuclease ABC subunit A|uniref:Excinuclease ABC subunit A n=2 Tax=Rhizobium mongolense TaxID=57676 RepID=A0A1G4T2Z6_9HYPH|nr:excinuclease ABC subunit A [Rhizobium mongolense]TDW34756.1 hypothetical protein EV128_10327 [Rhizobium azibense]SCW75768.1 excinuclease ABC subunit A [Rhizobium mongolense subsp. loessense]
MRVHRRFIHKEFCSLFVLVYGYDPVNRIENLATDGYSASTRPAASLNKGLTPAQKQNYDE